MQEQIHKIRRIARLSNVGDDAICLTLYVLTSAPQLHATYFIFYLVNLIRRDLCPVYVLLSLIQYLKRITTFLRLSTQENFSVKLTSGIHTF